jgi:hypothetical protein
MQQIISRNLSVIAFFGLTVSLCFALFGKDLFQQIIPDVLVHAHSREPKRSIGAAAIVMGMVSQVICLASLNLHTPALEVISTSVSNLLGDYFLARKFGSNGVAAAAATMTVCATITISATVLLSSMPIANNHSKVMTIIVPM